MSDAITPSQFLNGDGVGDWRIISDGAVVFYPTSSLAQGARLVAAIGGIEGVDEHPPAIDIRPDGVTVRTVTWREGHGGMTERDLAIATAVSRVADELGLTADPTRVQSVLIIPGAPDISKITPFWRAAFGYEPRPDSPVEDLVDPGDRGPAMWFETMDEPRADGGGTIHIAVWVPFEQAQARIDAALAAGGRMVRDQYAPAFWTLADEYGNEVDIATVNSRD